MDNSDQNSNSAKQTILVVEDNEELLSVLAGMLDSNGYRVIKAANGVEALKLFRDERVDLIVTDLIMPEKSGLDILQDLRRRHAGLKVIAISGGPGGNSAWLPIAKEFGALRILKKPFSCEVFLTTVRECLDADETTPVYALSFEPF